MEILINLIVAGLFLHVVCALIPETATSSSRRPSKPYEGPDPSFKAFLERNEAAKRAIQKESQK